MLLTGGDNEIIGGLLLEHEPLHFYVIPGVTPVTKCIQVSDIQAVLQPQINSGECPCDFSGNEGLSPDGGLVVKQDAIACIDSVGLTIVHRDPISIKLGTCVG